MGTVTRLPGDQLVHPIDATPFATYVDDLALELGSMTTVAERMGCDESWLRQGAFRRLGLIEREKALDLLDGCGAEVWALYPDECDVPLEDEAFCARCHENVTPIEGKCPWCENAHLRRNSRRVKRYCPSCDEMTTATNGGDCWRCGGDFAETPFDPCKCGCGVLRCRFDPQGRRTMGYIRGHAPLGVNAGMVPAAPFRLWLEERLENLDVVSALARECGIKRETVVATLQSGNGDEIEREVVRRAVWVSARSGSKGKGAKPRPDAQGFFDLYPEDKRARTCPGCGNGKAPHAEMCKNCRRKAGTNRPPVALTRVSEDVLREAHEAYWQDNLTIVETSERFFDRTPLTNIESFQQALSREWRRRGWPMRTRTVRRAA